MGTDQGGLVLWGWYLTLQRLLVMRRRRRWQGLVLRWRGRLLILQRRRRRWTLILPAPLHLGWYSGLEGLVGRRRRRLLLLLRLRWRGRRVHLLQRLATTVTTTTNLGRVGLLSRGVGRRLQRRECGRNRKRRLCFRLRRRSAQLVATCSFRPLIPVDLLV